MKNPKKPLTEKQLYKKVVKEFRAIQRVELDILKSVLPKIIASSAIPLEWRMEENGELYKFLLNKIQIDWTPVNPELKALHDKVEQKLNRITGRYI